MAERMTLGRVVLTILLCLAIVGAGGAGFRMLVQTAPKPETHRPEIPVPVVRVQPLAPADLAVTVAAQGTVVPPTETALVAEVPGRVVEISPALAQGGFIRAGEVLVRLEKRDFELARVRARAALAQARMKLVWEKAQAEIARAEWKTYGKGEPDLLVRREPQLAEAEAGVAASEAALEQAERDLQRAEIAAPYAGRVRQKRVDVGQYVTPGTVLAHLYAIDAAEVRLPVPQEETAFLDLPLAYEGEGARPGPAVTLRARFGDRVHEWTGTIVRTEAEIDPKSRMLHAVARVESPYAKKDGRPPLMVGLFVEAEIAGRVLKGVTRAPRSSLRDGERLLVVDAESKLRLRKVALVRSGLESVLISSGIQPGDRVCVSPVDAPVDGMAVRAAEDPK